MSDLNLDFVEELPPVTSRGGAKGPRGSKYAQYLPTLQAKQGVYAKVQGWQDKVTTAGAAFRTLGCLTSTRRKTNDDGTVQHALYVVWPTDEQKAADDARKASRAKTVAKNQAKKNASTSQIESSVDDDDEFEDDSEDIFGRDV